MNVHSQFPLAALIAIILMIVGAIVAILCAGVGVVEWLRERPASGWWWASGGAAAVALVAWMAAT